MRQKRYTTREEKLFFGLFESATLATRRAKSVVANVPALREPRENAQFDRNAHCGAKAKFGRFAVSPFFGTKLRMLLATYSLAHTLILTLWLQSNGHKVMNVLQGLTS